MSATTNDQVASREELRDAERHRATLGDLDAALLDAWEPALRDPADLVEREHRMDRLVARFAPDPYILTLAALAHQRLGHTFEPLLEQAIATDRTYSAAYTLWEDHAQLDGDDATRRVVTKRCLEAIPSSLECLDAQGDFDFEAGNCNALEADARRMIAIDPSRYDAYETVAAAMAGRGEPVEGIRAVLDRGLATVTEDAERRTDDLKAREWFAIRRGDFAEARTLVQELIELVSKSSRESPAMGLLLQVAMMLEMRDMGAAREFVQRADTATRAWVGVTRWDLPALLAFEREHVGLDTAEQRRTTVDEVESSRRRALGTFPPAVWLYTYGLRDLSTPEDGRDAVAALARLSVQPKASETTYFVATAIGRAEALAGLYAEAIPFLEVQARGCGPGRYASGAHSLLNAIQDLYWLGLSREKTGDPSGAKQAYDRVLAYWGKAKPLSVTADAARAGLARLAKASPVPAK